NSPTLTGTLANTATVSPPAGTTDTDNTNRSEERRVGKERKAELTICKSDGKSTAVPGTDVTYTITVTNNGPSTVNGATVSDVLPDGTSYVSGGSYDSGSNSVSFTTRTLPKTAHQAFTLAIHNSPSLTGTLANTATVSPPAGTTDTDNTN